MTRPRLLAPRSCPPAAAGFRRRGLVAVLLAWLAAATVGCAADGGGRGFPVSIALDEAYAERLGDDRVFVHVVPVNPRDRQQLERLAIEDYWGYGEGGRAVPREAGTAMWELSPGGRDRVTIDRRDPLWQQWRALGARELLVLSSRPVQVESLPGEQDPRRRFISADPTDWPAGGAVIAITEGGLRVRSPQRQP